MKHFADQEQLARYVRQKLTAQIDRTEALTRDLSDEQRARERADGGWSVDQILAHLARMNETYVAALGSVAARSSARGSRDRVWKPTLGGRALHWGVTTTIPMWTPRIFQPGRLTRDGDAFVAFVESHRAVLRLVDAMSDKDWRRTRFASPATPLLRLNAGDAFLVLADHAERHMRQLQRQRESVLAG